MAHVYFTNHSVSAGCDLGGFIQVFWEFLTPRTQDLLYHREAKLYSMNVADFTHPTAEGYAVMVEHIYPLILDAIRLAESKG